MLESLHYVLKYVRDKNLRFDIRSQIHKNKTQSLRYQNKVSNVKIYKKKRNNHNS